MAGSKTKKYGTVTLPEDKHQEMVQTPYGRGMVIRTRPTENTSASTREIELLEWSSSSKSSQSRKPAMLYSSAEFPTIPPVVGDDVMTSYGRGRVIDIRDGNGGCSFVVLISSWRLAGRSRVTCYLSPEAVRVVRPHKIYEMSVHEKVEHAQELKQQAAHKFARKDYNDALKLYAEAVDAVRYIQHKKDSTNEVRADLLVVMITCCNNAATCCLHLKFCDRAQKFGKNALVLIDALYEKKGNSRIHQVILRDGVKDSQLFGTWKIKSYLVIAKGLMEKHETDNALINLKKALKVVERYRKVDDPNIKQIQLQDKEIRKLVVSCKERQKADRKKEKERAQAMFAKPTKGGTETASTPETISTLDADTREFATAPRTPKSPLPEIITPKATATGQEQNQSQKQKGQSKKRVSFADGRLPGDEDGEDSFLEEHKEALIILGGIALGAAMVHLFFRRKR